METRDQPVINASELGEFTYCRCAWWLGRVQGLASTHQAALAQGRALHQAHGRRAQHADWLRGAALWALVPAAVLFVAGILLLLAG